jgi:hypothetical protein
MVHEKENARNCSMILGHLRATRNLQPARDVLDRNETTLADNLVFHHTCLDKLAKVLVAQPSPLGLLPKPGGELLYHGGKPAVYRCRSTRRSSKTAIDVL